ncbi:MAG: response regulator transcription factor [Cyanobacteriota bacterium]|nr:response regulator transcription factor [Cyanobacteriota bacterium]
MADSKEISVLLVDDEISFRQGLRTLLGFYNNQTSLSIDIIGEASSVDKLVKLAAQKSPDLILLDLELAVGDGITALVLLKEISYQGKVLILSGHQEEDWIFRAMQAGAAGYVFKNRIATQLCEAINTVMNSDIYLPSEVASRFFKYFQNYSDSSLRTCHKLRFTDREKEVLRWLSRGVSNEEISQHLYITSATVKAHLTSIFKKLKVSNRSQAIVAALKLEIINV